MSEARVREPRTERALVVTIVVLAAMVVGLGVLGLALVALAGDRLDPWPGLTMMLVGQAAALPALVLAVVARRRGRRGDASRVRAALRATPIWLGAALLLAVVGWLLAEPDLWLPTVGCALVAGQVGIVARLLGR